MWGSQHVDFLRLLAALVLSILRGLLPAAKLELCVCVFGWGEEEGGGGGAHRVHAQHSPASWLGVTPSARAQVTDAPPSSPHSLSPLAVRRFTHSASSECLTI